MIGTEPEMPGHPQTLQLEPGDIEPDEVPSRANGRSDAMPERVFSGAVQRPARADAAPVTGTLPRVVWHSTETDAATTTAATIAKNLDREDFSVHLVWNPVSGATVQAIPADRYGRGLKGIGFPTNTMGNPCIQIEVVGFAAHPFTGGPCTGLDPIMD